LTLLAAAQNKTEKSQARRFLCAGSLDHPGSSAAMNQIVENDCGIEPPCHRVARVGAAVG